MAKRRIRLLHDSSHPDATGGIGDLIECDEAIAARFIEGRGAVEVEDDEETAPSPALARRKSAPKTKEKAEAATEA